MEVIRLKKLWDKISFRMIILTAIVFIPMLVFLLIFNIQINRGSVSSLMQENQRNLDVAAQQLDNIFEITETLLKTLNNDSGLLDTIRNHNKAENSADNPESITESEYRRSVQLLYTHLQDSLAASEITQNAFIYIPSQELFYNSRKEPDMAEYIHTLILSDLSGEGENLLNPYQKNWTTVCLNDQWYLLRIWKYYPSYNGYYIGAWFTVDTLLESIHININEAYDLLYLSKSDGTPLSSTGIDINPQEVVSGTYYRHYQTAGLAGNAISADTSINTSFYYMHAMSEKAPVRLVKLLGKQTVQEMVPHISTAIILMSGGFILLIILYVICTRRWLISPVSTTMQSMNTIRKGDIEHRVPVNEKDCIEFRSLDQLFNEMMDQVSHLKNEIYESQLERQEIRLEYLQQQIQPHFILNTLNTLYNHTEGSVQKEIILLMTRYYRFVVNMDSRYVQLTQELEHIRNYLKLQQIRYPNAFDFDITCEAALEIIPIPPFLIESFVGNSIKHALNFSDRIMIRIEASQIDSFTARIRISDTGEGFDEDILDMINDYLNDKTVCEDLGVGIRNSIERLRLIYDDKASIQFYNQEQGGAVVEIDLSLQMH